MLSINAVHATKPIIVALHDDTLLMTTLRRLATLCDNIVVEFENAFEETPTDFEQFLENRKHQLLGDAKEFSLSGEVTEFVHAERRLIDLLRHGLPESLYGKSYWDMGSPLSAALWHMEIFHNSFAGVVDTTITPTGIKSNPTSLFRVARVAGATYRFLLATRNTLEMIEHALALRVATERNEQSEPLTLLYRRSSEFSLAGK